MNGNNDSIAIIGANLYGCLTAAKLSIKFPNKKITVYDAGSKILQSFESIKLEKYFVNNGFHSIELPRAAQLVNFLKNKIKVKIKLFPNIRKQVIQNYYINEHESLVNYPKDLKNFFKKKKLKTKYYDKFLKSISPDFRKTILRVAKRYNTDFKNVAHFFIPWFFPKEYIFSSPDEGEVFRNKVRSGKLIPTYAIPSSGRVENLRKNFNIFFKKKKNVKLALNTGIFAESNKLKTISSENKDTLKAGKIFICLPPFFLAGNKLKKKITQNYKFLANVLIKLPKKYKTKKFTEIIFCSPNFPSLGRITNTNYFIKNNDQLLQAELILSEPKELKKINLKDKFFKEIRKVYPAINKNEIDILDSKITRKVFYPDIKFINLFKLEISKKLKKLKNKTFYNFFLGPINMSKQWKFSEYFLNKVK
jgi:hypothetical protein